MDIVSTVSAALLQILGDELDRVARDCEAVVRHRRSIGRTLLLMVVATLLHEPDATWADLPDWIPGVVAN